LLFLIFLVSILVLEGILRHDAAHIRKIKRLPPLKPQPGPLKPAMDEAGADTSNVLTLAKAIEQHSLEARRPVKPQLGRTLSSDPSTTPAPVGSRPLE
jgi:hypothetical protein